MILNDATRRELIQIYAESEKPVLIMMVGVAGSGKSTVAERIASYFPMTEVVSSDAMRKQLFGDEGIQGNHSLVFRRCYDDIFNKLYDGVNVVFDATNLSASKRQNFIGVFKNIGTLVCIVQIASLEQCLEQNDKRERKVPRSVIRRMYNQIDYPQPEEGFYETIFNYAESEVE